jgi:hypothetical protein
VGAGGVVGSATPEGQCQWSPWGSHDVAVASVVVALAEFAVDGADVAVAEAPVSADSAGGVVGSATPDGQCLKYQSAYVFSISNRVVHTSGLREAHTQHQWRKRYLEQERQRPWQGRRSTASY